MMMEKDPVTLEKAVASIRSAAEELSPDDFIDFSVILDVHINWSLEELSPEEQCEFLKALKGVLESHAKLTVSIAWDLVIVLLPYLDSPFPGTVETAESLIAHAAQHGNPREVYIKVLQGLSSLSWSLGLDADSDEDNEDAEFSGDEDSPAVLSHKATGKSADPALHARNALRRFKNLLSALGTVHPRISAKFPSKFLSTELSTLLIAFTKASEVVDGSEVVDIVERLLGFLKIVRPQLAQLQQRARPPLPPRTSTATSIKTVGQVAPDSDSPEDQLQSRLIASFLSHVLCGFLLRSQRPFPSQHTLEKHEGHVHPLLGGFDDAEERGIEIGWAGKYDEEVLRPNKSKVPGGKTLIDMEREERAARANIRAIVDEISFMCEKLGLKTKELLELCQAGAEVPSDGEDDGSEIPAPKAAAEVPLSKHGALFLLAHFLSTHSSEALVLQIYPEHSAIAEAFMIYSPGQSQPAVIDAILFLGALALETGGLGDIPESTDAFFIYLQIFSVISTNAASAQCRFLANSHVARCLRAHPSEAVRLAYVRDTLEHCPFESVKAAVVGMLKDEIVHASTPVLKDGNSQPSTPNSIFGTPLCLTELFDVLFPDLEQLLERGWERFREVLPRISAIVNLYLLLLLNEELGHRLGAFEKLFREKLESRFLKPLRDRLEELAGDEKKEGEGSTNVLLLRMTMERVEEVRVGVREE